MDDDEKDGAKRAEIADQSQKLEDVLKRVARPAWRSPLFLWLVEHHDALRRNEAETGRGVPWRELCVEFVGLGITLADGRPVKPATARITWQRVRKELARVQERRARERAERERRAAVNPRRDMPSQFRKGDWGPPLATTSEAPTPGLPATTVQQAQRGFQLSTAEGVVVTRAGRVVKTEQAVNDYVFEESGMIVGSDFRSSVLRVKQQLNVRGLRPINDSTETLYADLGLVWTKE
jgi:hypothetical protein